MMGSAASTGPVAIAGTLNATATATWGKTFDDLIAHTDATIHADVWESTNTQRSPQLRLPHIVKRHVPRLPAEPDSHRGRSCTRPTRGKTPAIGSRPQLLPHAANQSEPEWNRSAKAPASQFSSRRTICAKSSPLPISSAHPYPASRCKRLALPVQPPSTESSAAQPPRRISPVSSPRRIFNSKAHRGNWFAQISMRVLQT